jgi:hypothetical protein
MRNKPRKKLEECLLWMGNRYADRARRGVEGKREA